MSQTEKALGVKIVPAEQARLQLESLRGPKGEDGYSPQIDVQETDAGIRITIRDRDGERTQTLTGAQAVKDLAVLEALGECDLLRAVHDAGGVLCDEEENILEW